ncbi:MAG: gas vesicle protein GvpG, partial [Chloroflexi bacterium]|nr:gas vesicle protein GvpG [Chloroflexota bacterium]
MGFLAKLLLLPITGPARGLVFVLEQIKERVDAEQLDEGLVEDELVTLSLRHDLGEVDDADYFAQETALLERLNAIRAYKESLEGGRQLGVGGQGSEDGDQESGD